MHNTYRRHDNFRYTALAVAYRSTYAVRLSNSSLVCERELPSSHITNYLVKYYRIRREKWGKKRRDLKRSMLWKGVKHKPTKYSRSVFISSLLGQYGVNVRFHRKTRSSCIHVPRSLNKLQHSDGFLTQKRYVGILIWYASFDLQARYRP